MRCPVHHLVGGYLLGGAAIRMDAPDLRSAVAVGVEIDEMAVGREVRIVVRTGTLREGLVVLPIDADGVEINPASCALRSCEQNRFAVGGPAMPVGIHICDGLRDSPT